MPVPTSAFPRVMVTRKLQQDGSRYFGPYTNVGRMRQLLEVVKRLYTVRSCRYDLPDDAPARPCLDYHIGKCLAPCVGAVTREAYRESIERICLFLQGHQDELVRDLRARMNLM